VGRGTASGSVASGNNWRVRAGLLGHFNKHRRSVSAQRGHRRWYSRRRGADLPTLATVALARRGLTPRCMLSKYCLMLCLHLVEDSTWLLHILGLFFGQRMAKDYAGAAILVPYFLLTLVAIYLFAR